MYRNFVIHSSAERDTCTPMFITALFTIVFILTPILSNMSIYSHPAYLNYMQSTSCEMLGWMKHKLESRLLGEILITSDLQMTPSYGRKRRKTKEKVKEEREKTGLKFKIQKPKIMASGPIVIHGK